MKSPRCFLALTVVIFISGCTSAPTSSSALAPLPKRVRTDAATIVFFRPTSPPAAVKGMLQLDGNELGQVFVRRYALINVNPGTHEIRFAFPFWAGVPAQSVTLECEPNKTYYLSYTSLLGIRAVFVPVGIVALKISPEMNLVAERDAKPFMAKFDVAFSYGEKEPAVPTPMAAAAPDAPSAMRP